jgi:hypothetical protein
LLGITNTKEIRSQFVKQQAESAMIQYKLKRKVDKLQQADQQEEQAKTQRLQAAIEAARRAEMEGSRIEEQGPSGTMPEQGLTQGQMLEADMMQQGLNAMDTGQFAENTPMPEVPPEVAGAMPMPGGAGMEGGLPGAMGGMIPGQGLAGTPDQEGVMR